MYPQNNKKYKVTMNNGAVIVATWFDEMGMWIDNNGNVFSMFYVKQINR